MFLVARERASESGAARRKGVLLGLAGLGIGLVAALVGPGQFRPTVGTPGIVLTVVLLKVLGGGLALLSFVLLIGTVTAPRGASSSNWTQR
ncbi:MAG: hypothetical protein EXR93_09855 [Gemmatimonadetes bacterium]|nr:hypothetical protein [Gemmatimonadota bacterium]